MDLGPLGVYGRFAGVNWVWSVDLTIYHAVFSITIPVLLVQRTYPDRESRPWLSRRGQILLGVLLGADVALGFFALTPYRPPAIPYLLAASAVAALIGLARRLPTGRPSGAEPDRAPMRPRAFLLGGFAATVGFFFLAWVAPSTTIPPSLLIVVTLASLALVWRLGRWTSRSQTLSPTRQLAAASGALGFFILLAPLQEIDPTRPDNTAGMALVGIGAALFLVMLARSTRSEERPKVVMGQGLEVGRSLPSELP
jgi:drug/metabolite transporter (DMT)-like permease